MNRPQIVLGEREHLLPASGIYLTPSDVNPWRDTRQVDEVFSRKQLSAMPLYQLDPATCDYVIVRSPMSMRECWWPQRARTPAYLLPCPIIPTADAAPRADGRLLVIAPAGMKKLVYPDGSITNAKPARPRRWAA